MPEKVYGISETNKCRKEVIAKEEIAILTGEVTLGPPTKPDDPQGGGGNFIAFVSYPEGFTRDNSVIIFAGDPYTPSQLSYRLDSSRIGIYNWTSETVHAWYRIVLAKIR